MGKKRPLVENLTAKKAVVVKKVEGDIYLGTDRADGTERGASWGDLSREEAAIGRLAATLSELNQLTLRTSAQSAGLTLKLPSIEAGSASAAYAFTTKLTVAMEEGRLDSVLLALQAMCEHVPRKRALSLFEDLRPFCVNAAAAEVLREATLGPPETPVVGVNAHKVATARLYTRRAALPHRNWRVEAVLDRQGEREDLIGEVQVLLDKTFPSPVGKSLNVRIRRRVQELKQPCVVVLQGEVFEQDLERLTLEFPDVRFFVLTGTAVPKAPNWRWSSIRFLDPALQDGVETSWDLHEDARDELARVYDTGATYDP